MRRDVEVAAQVLAAELAASVPLTFEGADGWYAVAERVLEAADQAREEEE